MWNHFYLNVLLDVLKRSQLLGNSCVFPLPVLSHVLLTLSLEVDRIRLHKLSSFYTFQLSNLVTPSRGQLTESPLSAGCLLMSLEHCQRLLSLIPPSSVSMVYQTRTKPALMTESNGKARKNGYKSRADCAGSINCPHSTALGMITFLLLKYLPFHICVFPKGIGNIPAWLKIAFKDGK